MLRVVKDENNPALADRERMMKFEAMRNMESFLRCVTTMDLYVESRPDLFLGYRDEMIVAAARVMKMAQKL